MSVSGKTVLITGASKGIGAAAARLFAEGGANVALVARTGDAISELAAGIGDQALAIPCDVSDSAAVADAVAQTVGKFGRLDVLVNNAGVVSPIARIEDCDADAWGQVIDINLKGVFYGVSAAMPEIVRQGGGSILTVSSGAAHSPIVGWSHYCASKAGAAMLTQCIDKEMRGAGIRAMGLSPGTVATDMQVEIKASGINPVSRLDWSEHIPPEWPARALVWMCSTEADRYVGEEISLRDEGMRARIGLI